MFCIQGLGKHGEVLYSRGAWGSDEAANLWDGMIANLEPLKLLSGQMVFDGVVLFHINFN